MTDISYTFKTGDNVDTLPEEFLNATLIHFYYVDKLPDNINDCKNLHTIKISESDVDNLIVPENVLDIELDYCLITTINIHDSLLRLVINNCNDNYHINVSKNTQLTILNILKDNENIKDCNDIPNFIREFKNLQNLFFETTCKDEIVIPNWIGELSKLNYIDLSTCNIKEIPESMKNLKNLNTLILDLKRIATDISYYDENIQHFGT